MSHKYDGMRVSELRALWEEKRRRIEAKGVGNITNAETLELLSIRKEIAKRTGDSPRPVKVDFASEYLTD